MTEWNWAEWVILLYLFGCIVGHSVACYFGVGSTAGKSVNSRWRTWLITMGCYAVYASIFSAAGLWG